MFFSSQREKRQLIMDIFYNAGNLKCLVYSYSIDGEYICTDVYKRVSKPELGSNWNQLSDHVDPALNSEPPSSPFKSRFRVCNHHLSNRGDTMHFAVGSNVNIFFCNNRVVILAQS